MDFKEAALIEEIKHGNQKAFEELFNQLYSKLCTYACDILNDKEFAEEVVQDVFLKFWNNRSSLHIKISLKAYLFRMTHNGALNFIRDYALARKKDEISFDDLNSRGALLNIQTSYDVFDELLLQQIEAELGDAIEKLPTQCKEIFCMARYQGHSYSEIAEKIGVSVSTVKTQMLRAIDKLKTTLDAYLN